MCASASRPLPAPLRPLPVALLLALGLAALPDRLQTQEPAPQPRELSPMMAGHAAFGEGRYDDAIRLYRLAAAQGARLGSAEDWLPELTEAAVARRNHGPIAPADTHRIGVIYVIEMVTVGRDGLRRSRPDVTPAQKETWRIYFALLRQVVEAFSGGGWALSFDEVNAVSSNIEGGRLAPWNPDLLDLDRYFLQHADSHDTYITLSNSVSPALGLPRRYPILSAVAYGPTAAWSELMLALTTGPFCCTSSSTPWSGSPTSSRLTHTAIP